MDPLDLNLRHLRALIAIVRGGSINTAVMSVHLTQPAITQGIAGLETALGVDLFERGPGSMAPTATAKIFVPRVEAAIALIGNIRVTATQIRSFLALAAAGSYRGASKITGTREPSLHRAVGDLAAVVGHELVNRQGRGVILSRKGQDLARRYGLARAELRAGFDEIASVIGAPSRRIVIGAMPLSRARLVPNVVAAFHRLAPRTDVIIVEGSFNELVGPLRRGDMDLMLGALRGEVVDDLVQEPLFDDRPVVLGRADHPLLKVDEAPSVSALAQCDWVMPGRGTPIRDQWEQIFAQAEVDEPRVAIETGSVIVLRRLLTAGDFLTLLSPDQVEVELKVGLLERVCPAPGEPRRRIGMTTRIGWRPTPTQASFLDLVRVESAKMDLDQN